MLGSISNRAPTFASYPRPSAPSTRATGTDDSFSQAISSSNTKTNTAGTNSPKLETYKPSSSVSVSPGSFNFDLNYNNVDHTQAEFNAHYAEGARLVSQSQGLPEGQYDFSRMSTKQLYIVANDMIVNKGASPEAVAGINNMLALGQGDINAASDAPTDFITALTNERDFHANLGQLGTARNDQAALEYIKNLSNI